MKRKLLLPILSVCMVVALVSVGFAAWLITGADTDDTATGQFVTESVTNEYFVAKVNPENGSKFVFGQPSGDSSNTSWFEYKTETDTENLSVNFDVVLIFDSLSNENDCKTAAAKWNIDFNIMTEASEYTTAITNGYITEPTFKIGNETLSVESGSTVKGTYAKAAQGEQEAQAATGGLQIKINGSKFTTFAQVSQSDITNTAAFKTEDKDKYYLKATVTVVFTWGSAFGKSNPYTYYNGANFGEGNNAKYDDLDKTAKADLRTKAQSALETLYQLNGKEFKITLDADKVS